MATIEELVGELNELGKRWIAQKEAFTEKDKFFEILTAIKEQGYYLSFPRLEFSTPVYEHLSDQGKHDFDEMMKIRKMKLEAIDKHEYERAADLRDIERQLISKIQIDFSSSTNSEHFILAGKMSDLILFNDPDNILIALIK